MFREVHALHEELGRRALHERIVEAHGDLRPEHVCLSAPPVVIDCLEFSSDLRILDALEELAFFCVGCTTLGAQWIASCVLDVYRERTGDLFSAQLLEFYCSMSAATRARLTAWHVLDPAMRNLAPWTMRATGYLRRALDHARAAR